jgi:ribose transport system substrate-binding protein
MAAGAIVAAERAGLTPSSMVFVGSGCEPIGVGLLKSGKLYGTVLQSPVDEAHYVIDGVVDYLNGKKIEKLNFIPHPTVTSKDDIDHICKPWPTGSR